MIYEKLAKIQNKNLSFKKDAENPFFKSSYLTLDNLNRTLLPILEEHNLVLTHRTLDRNVITEVYDTEDNTSILSSFPLPEGVEPQKIGSAITYAKRYNTGQIFNIVTDEDDDGNATKPKVESGNKDIDDLDL